MQHYLKYASLYLTFAALSQICITKSHICIMQHCLKSASLYLTFAALSQICSTIPKKQRNYNYAALSQVCNTILNMQHYPKYDVLSQVQYINKCSTYYPLKCSISQEGITVLYIPNTQSSNVHVQHS